MKILLIALTVMSLFSAKANAADEIIAGDITVPLGGQAELDIQMNNETELTAFQFEIRMAEGISVAKDDRERLVYLMGDRFQDDAQEFTLSISNPEENKYIVLGYHTVTCPISGSSGTIVTAMLEASADLTVGETYYCTITNIILTDLSGQKQYQDDVTFAVTVGDGRVKFDENSKLLPIYDEGDKCDIRMTRRIRTGVWNTIVLPFTLTKAKAEAIFGTDVELATFSGFDTEYTDEDDITPNAIVVNFSAYKMSGMRTMKGGNLYLIRIHKDKDIESFEADDVTLTRTVTATSGSGTVTLSDGSEITDLEIPGKFTGSLVKTVVPADGLFISNDEFWYSTGKTDIKAFRGWFELDAVLDKETDFGAKVRISINGDPTCIEDIQAEQVVDGVYNMQGMFIGDNVELNRLPKGIYIVNGKKVMVK